MILNDDGSVYHLHLKPDHIADTIITVGDPDRVDSVSRHFDRIEFKGVKREFVTHTGYIGQKRLTVLSTGIGPDNIDIVLNELDMLANMDLENRQVRKVHKTLTIVRLGTSGTICSDIPVHSLIVSDGAAGLDNLLHFYHAEKTEEETAMEQAFNSWMDLPSGIVPYFFLADKELVQAFGSGFTSGITLTAPGFYGPQGRQVHAAIRIPDLLDRAAGFRSGQTRITNIEMESAAIFGLCRALGHRAGSVNVILANRATGQFSVDPHRAVEQMIIQALEVITRC